MVIVKLKESSQLKTSFHKWKPIEIMLAVLFLVAPFYYHPNIGGEGFRMPNNITVWMVATIIIWYSFYQVLKRPTFVIPKYFAYIASFPILITLSGFVTGVEQPLEWLFRLLFIWGALAFFFSLFQHGLKQGRLDRILFVIVISALLQALVGIAQIWLRADMPFWLPQSPTGVPAGLFQQINNQASYQVTGIMISVYLITRPFIVRGTRWRQGLVITAVACASFLVMVSGSRIGLLTLVLGLIIVVPASWQRFKVNKKLSLVLFVVLLSGAGLGSQQSNNSVIDKTVAIQSGYSGSARLGMYAIAIDLIKQQPVFGHGIGSFGRVWQYAKPNFYKSHPDAVLPNIFISHPHNEAFFWLVEVGLIAGIGFLALIIGVILAIRKAGWSRFGANTAMLLPIFLHMQVELPMYSSVVHGMLFLFLLALIFGNTHKTVKLSISAIANKTLSYSSSIFFIVALIFLTQTIRSLHDLVTSFHITNPEQKPFIEAEKNPYFRAEVQWIKMNSILHSSIELGISQNVAAYTVWGERMLLERPDVVLFINLAKAYDYLGNGNAYCSVIHRGLHIYPHEGKFQQDFPNCNS